MSSDSGRSRRAPNKNASKKLEALSKLRSLRGGVNKYEVEEEPDVYDEVDEDEYSELVSKRQREDWIVDDDGAGYAEHGREIFDDEYDEDEQYGVNSTTNRNGNLNASSKKNKYNLGSLKSGNQKAEPKGDIRSMFASASKRSTNMTTAGKSKNPFHLNGSSGGSREKKSMNEVKIDDEEIESLVDAITTTPKPLPVGKGAPIHFSTPQPLKLQKKSTPTTATATPTLGSSASSASSIKRKSITAGRKVFGPPLKKRVLSKTEEFNFDEIIDQDEIKSISTNSSTITTSTSIRSHTSIKIKSEPDVDFDDDFMLPDNSAFDDFEMEEENKDVKPDVKNLDTKINNNKNADIEKLKATDPIRTKLEHEEWISSGTDQNGGQQSNNSNEAAPNILPKEIPFEIDEDKNKLIRFFWFDAFTDQSKNTDTVFLFGKVWMKEIKKFVSASVLVKNIERRIYLLPREHFRNDPSQKVTMQDVYDEFTDTVAKKMKLGQFRSRKVTKKYAFELAAIPAEAEYLEVLYSANSPPLPAQFHSGNTYRHVFGVNASILENLILDLDLKGPQWLMVKNPEISEPPITWCKIELSVQKQSNISVVCDDDSEEENKKNPPAPTPEFTVLSLNFKTWANTDTKQNEIVAISAMVNRSYKFEQSSNNDTKNAKANGTTNSKYDSHFCIITRPSAKTGVDLPIDFTPKMALKDYKKTTINRMNNERELLNFFLAKFHQIDPDIIVGHDIFAFDYELLLSRFAHYKIQNLWSKLGRLKRSGLPIRTKDKHLLAGRLICDIKIMARELIRAKSYDLTELSAQILKKGRFEIDQALLPNYYANSGQLIRLIEFLMKDNDLILSIMFELNCLPLVKQITNIAGNLLSRTLLGGRSERNEYLLLHAFYQKGYIVPDKAIRFFKDGKGGGNNNANKAAAEPIEPVELEAQDPEDPDDPEKPSSGGPKKKLPSKASAAKSSYAGGLVLEPKTGFYDKFILLMDFNSLYPSIIQEYNICFTTVNLPESVKNSVNESSPEEVAALLSASGTSKSMEGILPTEIRKLVESRRSVKKQLYDPNLTNEEKTQLDIKQKALKITANSMYGCLGFQHSRFYAKHLASLITFKGREILLATKELVEKIGYDVIYGDTDSIMILTNCQKYEEVRETGYKIQAEVNRLYKLLEIDIDGVFRCMLLLKKKKYAALTVSKGPNGVLQYNREIKGLDIVRRDWSMLAKIAGETVLDKILVVDKPIELIVDDMHSYLKQLADSLRANEMPLENFVINKALTKRPEEYNDGKLTHVAVALRYNQNNQNKQFRAGDTVSFVICLDGTTNPATQRGYHIDEVRQNVAGNLQVDISYYLSQQLLPVVSRLVDPIEGTDTGIIAEFLGVETYKRSSHAIQVEELDPALNSGDHKYDVCKSLVFACPSCKKDFEVRDLFVLMNKQSKDLKQMDAKELLADKNLFKLTMARCEHCEQRFGVTTHFYFEIQLQKQISDFVNRFYQKELYCDDHACTNKTRYLSGRLQGQKAVACTKCKNGGLQLEISDHLLYQQLSFFSHIFDFDSALGRFTGLDLSTEQKAERKALKDKYSAFFDRLRATVQHYLDQSSYNEFDLAYLFRKFRYNSNQSANILS